MEALELRPGRTPERARRWHGRVVLVTGGNGFVGSRLVESLVELGARVVALVRDLRPEGGLRVFGLEDRVTMVLGSVTDQALVERALRQYGAETCFHLAAQALVQTARSSPVDTFDSNVRGTWSVLEACRRVGVEVVVASTDKAYGTAPELPYVETQPLRGDHPYDASKVAAEAVVRSFRATYGMRVAITRCGNIYGGGDLNVSRLMPDVILAALDGRRPVLRSDGSHLRDFVHVGDAVNAYLTLAEQLERPEVAGEAFNFGSGQPARVRDVVDRILALVAPGLEPVVEDRVRGQEIPAQYLDSGKAAAVLGWRPEVDLEAGLRMTVDWYRGYVARAALALGSG